MRCLAGLAGCLFVMLPHGAVAASFDCGKARTPLEQLICKDPGLSRLDGYMGRVLRGRLAELPPEQRAPFLAMHRHWLRFRLAYCGLADNAPTSAVETETAARCVRSQYELHLRALRTACEVDKQHTLADFTREKKTYLNLRTFYVAQRTIPLGFSIVGGLRFYKAEWPRVPVYILPSTTLATDSNISSYIRAEHPWLRHNNTGIIALCSVRSPQGVVWLVLRNIDGSLDYVLVKDVVQHTN